MPGRSSATPSSCRDRSTFIWAKCRPLSRKRFAPRKKQKRIAALRPRQRKRDHRQLPRADPAMRGARRVRHGRADPENPEVEEQDHQIDLATALGVPVPNLENRCFSRSRTHMPCSLRRSKLPPSTAVSKAVKAAKSSSTDVLLGQMMKECSAGRDRARSSALADYNIKPGVLSDEGPGDVQGWSSANGCWPPTS